MNAKRTPYTDVLALIVGERIRQLRMAKGIGIRELARRIDSHGPIISMVEHGRHVASLDFLQRIARGLQVRVIDIVQAIDDHDVWSAAEERLQQSTPRTIVPTARARRRWDKRRRKPDDSC